MSFIDDQDRREISAAIQTLEENTSAELIAVVAEESDSYLYIPLLWASLIALLAPVALYFVPAYWGLFDAERGWGGSRGIDFALLHTLQVVLFAVFALLFRLPHLKFRLVPKSVRYRRAHWLALEQFFGQGLHLTRNHTGVLLFVSVGERYVEIIAGEGINRQVAQSEWDTVVAEFVDWVSTDRVAEGFVHSIGLCGKILAEHAPRRPGDVDELPNRLVEI